MKKKRITFMGCEDQKRKKDREHKNLDGKKKEKSHDSSPKPTTGYFHFSKKNRLKLVVEKLMEFGYQKRLTVKGSPA